MHLRPPATGKEPAVITVYHPEHPHSYIAALSRLLPGHTVSDQSEPCTRYAVVWNPPEGFFSGLSGLQGIFALGAGVDRLLGRHDLSPDIPIYRLTDAGMAEQMIEYARYGVLHWQRSFDFYRTQQQAQQWQVQPDRRKADTRISVLGLGEMGGRVAAALAGDGYCVSGYSRKMRTLAGVNCVHGEDQLNALLTQTDVLINLLPSTVLTRGLLNTERLALLPAGSALIHAGRGDQLDENALLAALDSGVLRFALLDVFALEPLAAGHPLWRHPRAIITPHSAAQTLIGEAAAQIAQRIQALEQGQEVTGKVERSRAY
ncbi:glyoxylate/hydroxypyruvate reductase A [Rhodobacteraceae bacterium CH30]|nr:glyoxylate/hydroxypyruvate reductase A [Rhodobacteraceae bacterium CH30]